MSAKRGASAWFLNNANKVLVIKCGSADFRVSETQRHRVRDHIIRVEFACARRTIAAHMRAIIINGIRDIKMSFEFDDHTLCGYYGQAMARAEEGGGRLEDVIYMICVTLCNTCEICSDNCIGNDL